MEEHVPQIGLMDNQFLRDIKSGCAFRSYVKVLQLGAGASKDFVFDSGNSDIYIALLNIKPFDQPLNFELYGETIYTGGTELFTINLASSYDIARANRAKLLENASISNMGILIDEDDYPGSTGGSSDNRIGFGISEEIPRIVAPNSVFSSRITNIGGSATDFYFRLFWSENRITS